MSASTYQILSIVAFSIAALLFILAVVLFFVMNIPQIIGELSGRTAIKQIKQIREQSSGAHIKQNYHNVLNSDRASDVRKTYDSRKLHTASGKIGSSPSGSMAGSSNSAASASINNKVYKPSGVSLQESTGRTGDMTYQPKSSMVQKKGGNGTVMMSEAYKTMPDNADQATGLLKENMNDQTEVLQENQDIATGVLNSSVDYPTGLLQAEADSATDVLQDNVDGSTEVLKNNIDCPTGILQGAVDCPTGVLDSDSYVQSRQGTTVLEQEMDMPFDRTEVLSDDSNKDKARQNEELINNQQLNKGGEEMVGLNPKGNEEQEIDINATTELSQSIMEQDQKSDQAIQSLFFQSDSSEETTELHLDENEANTVHQMPNTGKQTFTIVRSIVLVNTEETIQ